MQETSCHENIRQSETGFSESWLCSELWLVKKSATIIQTPNMNIQLRDRVFNVGF